MDSSEEDDDPDWSEESSSDPDSSLRRFFLSFLTEVERICKSFLVMFMNHPVNKQYKLTFDLSDQLSTIYDSYILQGSRILIHRHLFQLSQQILSRDDMAKHHMDAEGIGQGSRVSKGIYIENKRPNRLTCPDEEPVAWYYNEYTEQ